MLYWSEKDFLRKMWRVGKGWSVSRVGIGQLGFGQLVFFGMSGVMGMSGVILLVGWFFWYERYDVSGG